MYFLIDSFLIPSDFDFSNLIYHNVNLCQGKAIPAYLRDRFFKNQL